MLGRSRMRTSRAHLEERYRDSLGREISGVGIWNGDIGLGIGTSPLKLGHGGHGIRPNLCYLFLLTFSYHRTI